MLQAPRFPSFSYYMYPQLYPSHLKCSQNDFLSRNIHLSSRILNSELHVKPHSPKERFSSRAESSSEFFLHDPPLSIRLSKLFFFIFYFLLHNYVHYTWSVSTKFSNFTFSTALKTRSICYNHNTATLPSQYIAVLPLDIHSLENC